MTCINCKFPRKKYHLEDDGKCLYSPYTYQVRGRKRKSDLINPKEYELRWSCGCCGSVWSERLRISSMVELVIGCSACKAQNVLNAPFVK